MRILRKTQSLCDICFRKVPAITLIKKGEVYLEKNCPRHGEFTAKHFWSDPEIYKGLIKIKTVDPKSANLSIALTYKCNLHCNVCYARANEKTSNFKIKNLNISQNYQGVLLTGGEPTTRKDLPKIIQRLRKKGKRVTIFSNGVKLENKSCLKALKKSGLSGIIMQFDTLDEKTSLAMRGEDLIKTKIRAISNVQSEKIPLYLYSVALKKNPNEVKKIIDLAFRYPIIKMVSFNTLGLMGRCDPAEFYSSGEIINNICQDIKLEKKDWLESSRLLNTWDKFSAQRGKGRRLFSKCSLKWLALPYKDRLIPVTRIFEVKWINRNAERLPKIIFIFVFILREVLFNFVVNRNFRIFAARLVKNFKCRLQRKSSLFNPFFMVAVTVVPSVGNLDFDFLDECNIHCVTPDNLLPSPACLYRIKNH